MGSDKPSFLQSIRSLFNASDGPYAYEDFDGDEQPDSVSSASMERMFHIKQQNRLLNIVDELSMRQLRTLFNSATSGFIGELIDVYVQMEASDARLQGMLNARRNAVSRTPAVVMSGEKGNRQADEARDFVNSNIKHLKWDEFRRSLMDGRIYGVGLFENIWARGSNNSLYINEIKQIDHTLIEQYVTQYNLKGERFGEIVLRKDAMSPERIFLDELPAYKLIAAYKSNRDGYHDLEGTMRSIARWEVIKTFIIKQWAQYSEVYGFPVPIVKVSEEDFKKNKQTIKKLLQSVGVNRYGIFFKSMEYEVHQAGGQGQNVDVFERYIALANTEITIAALGQNLTTEVQGGSRSASETHYKVLEDLTQDDLNYCDEIIQEQFINPLVRVNFPSLPTELYPEYVSKLKRSVDLQALGLGLQAISRLVPVPRSYVYQQAQIPEPEEGEDVIDNSQGDELLRRMQQQN